MNLGMSLRISALVAVMLLGILPAGAQSPGVQFLGQGGTIDTPGHYALSRDILLNTSRLTGFMITADGVTLDLNGHQIMGPGGKLGTGILIEGANGVEVVNGSLAYLAFGVNVQNSNNVVLRNLRIRGQGLVITSLPPETGIMIAQSKNVVVEDNAIYNTGLGVFVRGSQSWGNRIAGNTLTANTNGALGICYNPTPSDPNAPRGDLVLGNLISGFGTGIQMNENSMNNVLRENTIAYINTGIENMNETNQDIDNVLVQLP